MKIPAGRELAFQLMVSLFTGLVCVAAGLIVFRWRGTTTALVGIATFLLALFGIGLAASSRAPGDKIER